MTEVLRWAQRVIDLADGDPTLGDLIFGSPLAAAIAFRGAARWCLGIAGWKDDFHQAVAMARASDPTTLGGVMWCTYVIAIPYGALLPDAAALRETAELLVKAEQSGDDMALDTARTARGVTLSIGAVRSVKPALTCWLRPARLPSRSGSSSRWCPLSTSRSQRSGSGSKS